VNEVDRGVSGVERGVEGVGRGAKKVSKLTGWEGGAWDGGVRGVFFDE